MVKYSLWGREVDLDLAKEKFPNDAELKEMDDLLPGSEHGWFDGPASGKALHYRKFDKTENKVPKAVCIWQHGIQSHGSVGWKLKSSGRILAVSLLSARLMEAGCALYSPDLAGHGFSEGTRFFIPDSNYKVNRDDLDGFARFVASQYPPETPLFLLSESYGGTLSLHVAYKWQMAKEDAGADDPPPGFRGLVLSAPAIVGDVPPFPVTMFLRYVLAPLYPPWTPFFMPNPVNSDRIWSDKEVLALQSNPRIKEMNIDDLGSPFRLGTAVALLQAVEEVRTLTIPNLKVPFCVMHGTKDAAVPIAGTDLLLEQVSTPQDQRSVLKVDGAFHDLMAEPTAESTLDFAMRWIQKQI